MGKLVQAIVEGRIGEEKLRVVCALIIKNTGGKCVNKGDCGKCKPLNQLWTLIPEQG